jgi:hypothetical protein
LKKVGNGMTDKKNLQLYILLLSVVIGALAAALIIHYTFHVHKGRLILGDSTHGLIKLHSTKNGLAEVNVNALTAKQNMPAGKFVQSLGSVN